MFFALSDFPRLAFGWVTPSDSKPSPTVCFLSHPTTYETHQYNPVELARHPVYFRGVAKGGNGPPPTIHYDIVCSTST